MSKVLCTKEKLVAIADAIRNKLSLSNLMTLDQMKDNINLISGIELIGVNIDFVNNSSIGTKSIQVYGFNENGELERSTIREGQSKVIYFPYIQNGAAGKISIYTPLMVRIIKTPHDGDWAHTVLSVESTVVYNPRYAVYGEYTEDRYLYLDLNFEKMPPEDLAQGSYSIVQDDFIPQ